MCSGAFCVFTRGDLASKEGAMVFNMLKGIRRLMLTTGLLCGVGLFLCAVDVKAYTYTGTVSISSVYSTGKEVVVKLHDDTPGEEFDGSISIYDNKNTSTPITIDCSSDKKPFDSDGNVSITFSKQKMYEVRKTYPTDYYIKNASLNGGGNPGTNAYSEKLDDLIKVTAQSASSTPYKSISGASYNIYLDGSDTVLGSGNPATAYVYPNEDYKITADFSNSSYYYMSTSESSTAPSWADSTWVTPSAGFARGSSSDIVENIYYLPKIREIKLNDNSYKLYVSSSLSETIELSTTSDFEVTTTDNNPDSASIAIKNMVQLEGSEVKASTDNKFTFKYSGSVPGEKTIQLVQSRTISGEETPKSGLVNVKIYPQETGFLVYDEEGKLFDITQQGVDFKKGETKSCNFSIKLAPEGSDNSLLIDEYDLKPELSGALTSSDLDVSLTKPTSSGDPAKLTITSRTGATHTGEGTITVKDSANKLPSIQIRVRIVEQIKVDSDKTKTAIKDAKKNFITVGKTMSIEDLIKKYAKNSNGDSLDSSSISVSKIDITSGSDYLSKDGTRISGKKAGNATIDVYLSGNTSSTADIRGLEIEVHPNKTEAKYDADARTLKITAPEKIYYALDDSDNIRDVSSVKVILENSNGDNLADKTFDFSSSSSSSHTREYTVSASDIENLVATAASNGKFNSDSTSVKFKVIPRGKKQSGDDTVDAKEELQGKSDITTVYRLTASGTNFGTSYAYGLNGQTVKLTASPNSGYTFEKWSDGNTSNPREIKVSSSGTKTFTAIAKQSVNPANGSTTNGGANGNGTAGDNSQLYDDVPKTAESNSAIWLIVFMVFAVMGTTYALYLQLRAATSKNDR